VECLEERVPPAADPVGARIIAFGGILLAVVREGVLVVRDEEVERERELALVVETLGAVRVGLGLAQRGQQQRRQHGDDGDDHQQFDQREPAAGVSPGL
jgi:hypothetical protein